MPLGFTLRVPVDDVETLLILMQSPNVETVSHAASLLTRWLSRGALLVHTAVYICLSIFVCIDVCGVVYCVFTFV